MRGLRRMPEQDTYCVDALTQVSAADTALRSCAVAPLGEHLDCCVTEAIVQGGDQAPAKIGEASQAIARLLRS
ncbi:metal-sensitive transcriptional regulator [Streptomyces enissocaesilis]|uniref:Metal-sensitive transcriptional regulator n=1 Tax=Streptomyces enissocaesilis TaxID=332589 RepID=A0ABP6K579_9ACTN